jgi:MFS family permease
MPRTLSRPVSFWVAAAVIAQCMWTSGAPSMTYPLYAQEWHLTPTATTGIFAVYPIGVVVALICCGDLSDYIGRRTAMLLGIAASALGVLLFAVAPGFGWVLVGRAFMGIGVGLATSPATAALVEFSAPGASARASSVTTLAQASGLTAAFLVGGALIEYAPFPTRLNFWVLFIVLVGVFAATWFLPHHTPVEAKGPWRPKALTVPRGLRWIFVTSALAVSVSFGIGTLMLSLGAQIAHDLVRSDNALVNGASMALFTIVIGLCALGAKRLSSTTLMVVGGLATAGGMALLWASAALHALVLFLAAGVALGAGYSLLFSGGLALINLHAPVHHRAGTLSSLYFVAYLLQGVTALLLGKAATTWGLEPALDIGAATAGALAIVAAGLAGIRGRAVA